MQNQLDTGGGGGSKFWLITKSFPKIFAGMFVIFIFVSTVSQGYQKAEETGNPWDFVFGFFKALIKPVISSDENIGNEVELFKSGTLLWWEKIIGWINIFGSLTVTYYVYGWIYKFINSSLEMASSLVIHGYTLAALIALTTLYNTAANGALTVSGIGGHGLFSLFTNFGIVFEPIVNIAEKLIGIGNVLPGEDLPIMK